MFNCVSGAVLTLLVCCGVACADPFAPVVPPQSQVESRVTASDYRVFGVVVSESRAVAVVQVVDGRIATLRPGERVGDTVVRRITSDGVYLDTGQGVTHLPVAD